MTSFGPKITLDCLPFDILALVIEQLDLFDFMRLQLVSRDYHQKFTDHDLCHFALTRLATSTPEAQKPNSSKVELDQLASRMAKYAKQKPSRVESIAIKANPNRKALDWDVAGDLLIYQTSANDSTSNLMIHNLKGKGDVQVNLTAIVPAFDPADNWKIWIPKSSERGSDFLCGESTRPSRILISGTLRTSPTETRAARRMSKDSLASIADQHTQVFAIVSLASTDCGNILCHWTSSQTITRFVANSTYFAYVTEEFCHKYNIAKFTDIGESKDAADLILTYAFTADKKITSLGADYEGKRLYVGSGTYVHLVQVIDIQSGRSLRQAVMPMDDKDFQTLDDPVYEFLQPKQGVASYESFKSDITLCCRDAQLSTMWKLSVTSNDIVVDSMKIKTHIINSSVSLTDKPALATTKPASVTSSPSFTITSVKPVQGKVSAPAIVIDEYHLTNNNNTTTSIKTSQQWLWPERPTGLKKLRSKDYNKHPLASIPSPTSQTSQVSIGCGWMIFSRDRSEQLGLKNLYGRIGKVQASDELVILLF